jgi:tape measure domain-containing protein
LNISTLDVAANLSVDGIKAGVEDGKKSLSGLVGAFIDLGKTAISPLGAVTGAVSGMVDSLAKVGYAAMGLKAVAQGAIGMVSALTSGNAALEMTTISFKTLLGSTQAANDMIKQLTSFAASTPFELTGLESSTQNLLAFGFNAKDIIPLMTSMGDAISALGGTQANLDSLVHVMGQMRQEAHINAGDIMQMTNLGIPALQMLADHYHVTTGAMQEMVSKGLVPGTDAIKIFQDGMEQRYGGMMAAQSATFSGMISNLHDWATSTTNTLTKPFFEPAKAGLKSLLDFVQSPEGVNAINSLAAHIQGGVDTITKLFKEAVVPVKVFLSAFQGTEVDGIKGFDTTAGQIATTLGMVAKRAFELYQVFSPLTTLFDVFKGSVTGGLEGGLFALEQRIVGMGKAFGIDLAPAMQQFDTFVGSALIPAIRNIATWVGTSLIPIIVSLGKTFINDILPKIGDFVKFIIDKVVPAVQALGQWVEAHIIPLIKALAMTFEKDIAPALGRFWDFLVAKVFPALGDLVDWISAKIVPVLGKIVAVIMDVVIPVLFSWWQTLATVLKPIIEWIADFIVNVFIPAFTAIGKFISEKVLPVVNDLVHNFQDNVMPVLKTVGEFIGGAFSNAFSSISTIIQAFIQVWANGILPVLGMVWNFISQNIIPIFTTLGNIIGTVVGGAVGGLMWAVNNIILPGFNLLMTVIGNVIDFVKTAVRTIANFFIDVINTPINLINTLIGMLKGIDIFGVKPFEWLPTIPTLGYLSFAQGTTNAPGGPAMVGDNPYGPEMVVTPNYTFMADRPTFMDLPRGSKVLTPGQYGGAGQQQVVIEQHFHISPDLDASLIPQLAAMAYQAAEQVLENAGQGGASKLGFSGAQR